MASTGSTALFAIASLVRLSCSQSFLVVLGRCGGRPLLLKSYQRHSYSVAQPSAGHVLAVPGDSWGCPVWSDSRSRCDPFALRKWGNRGRPALGFRSRSCAGGACGEECNFPARFCRLWERQFHVRPGRRSPTAPGTRRSTACWGAWRRRRACGR